MCTLPPKMERWRGPSFVHLCHQSSVPNNKTKQRNVSGALEQLNPTPVTVPHCHVCPQPRGISVLQGRGQLTCGKEPRAATSVVSVNPESTTVCVKSSPREEHTPCLSWFPFPLSSGGSYVPTGSRATKRVSVAEATATQPLHVSHSL